MKTWKMYVVNDTKCCGVFMSALSKYAMSTFVSRGNTMIGESIRVIRIKPRRPGQLQNHKVFEEKK